MQNHSATSRSSASFVRQRDGLPGPLTSDPIYFRPAVRQMQSESGSAHMPGQFYVVSAASRTTDVSSGADARHVCPRHVGFVVTAAFLSDKDVAHDTVVGATEGPVNTRSSSGSGSYDGLERIAMCGSWPRLSAAPICLRKPKSAPDKAGRTTGRHADELCVTFLAL